MDRRLTDSSRSPARGLLRWCLLLGIVALGACSGQSCDCEGFEQTSFPEKHLDKTVPKSGQVRVSKGGLDFFERQIPSLLDQFLSNGLSFCVPETTTSQGPADIKVCMTDTCQSGQTGCQMDLSLEEAQITPRSNEDRLDLEVKVGQLNEVIPLDITLGLTSECKVDLHKDGADNDVPATVDATVPVKFRVNRQSSTNNLSIRLGDLEPELGQIAFDIDGRGGFGSTVGCESVDLIKPAVRGLLLDRVKNQLNDTVQQAVKSRLCRTCGPEVDESCPSASSCQELDDGSRICERDNRDSCVPRTLGIEGELQLESLLSDFLEREEAHVDVMARAADLGDVDQEGVNVGLRTGFQPTEFAECVPADGSRRPDLSGVSESDAILTNTHPETGESFMLGIGLHERTLEHLAWSIWAEGGLCLKVGADAGLGGQASNFLTTDGLSLLVSGVEKLASRPGPVFLRVSPQRPPEVELGDNELQQDGDDYELADPLMRLLWNDLDVHFYAFVQDRYTRIFTIRTDVRVPLGATTDGNQLIPVIGDLEDAATNLRIRNNRILSDDPEQLESLIPSLISTALSQAGSLSDPIDLPSFGGFELALDAEDITSVETNSILALYADLAMTGTTPQSTDVRLRPTIEETTVTLGDLDREGLPRSAVRLDVSARSALGEASDDVEYSYRIDGGFWSMFTSSETLVLDAPLLALPGEHRIEVRARQPGVPGTASEPRETTVRVDYRPPEIDVRRDGSTIRLEAEDAVDEADELDYRYRLVADGEVLVSWSDWRDDASIELASAISKLNVEQSLDVVTQVRDRSGHVGESTETIRQPQQLLAEEPRDDRSRDERASLTANDAACSTTGGERSPGSLLPLSLLLIGFGWWRRRRRTSSETSRSNGWILSLVLLASLTVGCSDFSGQKTPCGGSCEANETCESGTCVPETCSSNDDCPSGAYCIDNTCRNRSCESDDDCPCGGGETGVCFDGSCSCDSFCPEGCGEDEYCCYAEDTCQSYPNPCPNKECGPGREATVVERGDIDRQSCTISGGTCECQATDSIPLKWHGSYASIDANESGVVAVSAYNRHWRDLMVGTLDRDLEPTWYFPDGVPEDGEIIADPEGPRGGTDDFGPEVGTHTAIAVDPSGRLHVFYRSLETGALKYARGTESGDSYQFERREIDQRGDTGYYTSAAIKDGMVHASYGVASIEGREGQRTQLRHVRFPVGTSVGELSPEPEVVYNSNPVNPCQTSCEDDEVCFVNAETCARPDDSCARPDAGSSEGGCEGDRMCRNGMCRETYEPPSTPAHRLMTGLYTETLPFDGGLYVVFYDHVTKRVGWATRRGGTWQQTEFLDERSGPYASGAIRNGGLHLAYMDAADKVLRYRSPDGATSTIADGVRNGDGEYVQSNIGQNVDLAFRSGTWVATFQDATRHTLHVARRTSGSSWQVSTLASPDQDGTYTGAHGFYSGMAGGVVVDFVIDQQADPIEAGLDFHALP